LLLVSASDPGRRIPQHQRAIDAAAEVGVGLVAYTSIANADRTTIRLAGDHQGTEAALARSGLPHVLLRNNLYLEVFTAQMPTYLAHGAIVGSAGEGRFSGASRVDLAEAAAAVLLMDDQAGAIHELGGDDPFSLPELAAEITAA